MSLACCVWSFKPLQLSTKAGPWAWRLRHPAHRVVEGIQSLPRRKLPEPEASRSCGSLVCAYQYRRRKSTCMHAMYHARCRCLCLYLCLQAGTSVRPYVCICVRVYTMHVCSLYARVFISAHGTHLQLCVCTCKWISANAEHACTCCRLWLSGSPLPALVCAAGLSDTVGRCGYVSRSIALGFLKKS